MAYDRSTIKASRPKFTKRIGKSPRPGDDYDFIPDGDPEWLNADLIKGFVFNSQAGEDQVLEGRLQNLGKVVVKDLEAYLNLGPIQPLVDAVGGDVIGLLKNVYHKRRKKSSGTILGITATGAAVGAGIGFFVIPGLGASIGAPLGVFIGAFGGIVATTMATLIFKRRAESLAKIWFPGEYRHDLDRRTTQAFKEKYGIPNHVLQLMNGYLHHRMGNIKNIRTKNVLANFIKIGIELQTEDVFSASLVYLGAELESIQKLYIEKHKDYHENKTDEKSLELEKLREDFHLLQYTLKSISEAKVDDESTIVFPQSLKRKIELTIPKIADLPVLELDLRVENAGDLLRSTDRLDQEIRNTDSNVLLPENTVGIRTNSPFSVQIPRSVEVVTQALQPLIGEARKQFISNVTDKFKLRSDLGVSGVEVIENSENKSIEFKFTAQSSRKPIPPIIFSQVAEGERTATRFSMKIVGNTDQEQIRCAANIMIAEIELLVTDMSAAERQDYQLDIDADSDLTSNQRIASAVHLSLGAKRLGLKPNLVGYSADDQEKIEEQLKALAVKPKQERSGASVTLKKNSAVPRDRE